MRLSWRIKIVVAVAVFSSDFGAMGQMLTVRLLNAKTGKPMVGENVTIIWCPDCMGSHVVSMDKNGVGQTSIPAGVNTVTLIAGPKRGKEPFRIPYIDCNGQSISQVDMEMIRTKGLVPANTCSQKARTAVPGEIVFWGMPRPWWQPDFQ